MESNYVILYKDNSKRECSLYQMSFGLSRECSVFEIIEGKEILLGAISYKTLIYIAIEFATYASKEYFPSYSMGYALEVARRWIDDPDSVSDMELSITSNTFLRDNFLSLYLINTIHSPNHYFYYLCRDIEKYSGNKQEGLRQNKFIVDFLKSGKHLFMV